MRLHLALVLLAGLGSGCAAVDAFFGDESRTVSGSFVRTYVSASRTEDLPEDLSDDTVEALVENGDGTYTTITGVGRADGTFTIDGVPAGHYWLRIGLLYYRTTDDVVEGRLLRQGRPDAVDISQRTDLRLDVTNLSAWSEGDQIELFSSEAANFYFEAEGYASAGVPVVNDTALNGFTVDLKGNRGSPNLIDGDRSPPDRLVVAQLERSLAGAVPYSAMTRIFEPAPFTLTDGQLQTLSGAFTDVSVANTVTFDVRADAARAALTEEGRPCPGSSSTMDWTVNLLGAAGGIADGIGGDTADLLFMDVPKNASNFVAEDMGYGVPLTGTWGVFGDVRFGTFCDFALPGGTTPATFVSGVGIFFEEPVAALASDPIEPRLGQVRAPTIGDMSLFVAQEETGTTPNIEWNVPSIGSPTSYMVRIWHLEVSSGAGCTPSGTPCTLRSEVGVFNTTETSLTVPPGVMLDGEAYVIGVDARRGTQLGPGTYKVGVEALPSYRSSVLSAILRP